MPLDSVAIENLIALEEGLSKRLGTAWALQVKPVIRKIIAAAEADDWNTAAALVDSLSFTPVTDDHQGYVETMGLHAVLLGASQIVDPHDSVFMQAGKPPPEIVGIVAQAWMNHLATVGIADIKTAAHELLAILRQTAHDQKYNFNQTEFGQVQKAEFGAAFVNSLNDVVLNGGKMLVDIGANLTTSRLISYGFLAQAQASNEVEYQINEVEYQINEVLDDLICPFCRRMHGRVFKVAKAATFMDTVLRQQDVEALKSLAPFPKQDKASLAEL